MRRHELEHVVRAAGAISGSSALVIVGSQAVLGAFPDAPAELLISQEADLYPEDDPSKADLIDGSIGELSPFHDQFGYYAHGVGPDTAILPTGWKSRLVRVENANTGGTTALCLHPSDLVVSKLAAGRPKDLAFVSAMLRHRLVQREELEERCAGLGPIHADPVRQRLARICQQ